MADTQKNIFQQLRRLVSNNIVVRRVGHNKLKVVDTAHLQSSGNLRNSKVIDRYGKVHTSRNFSYAGSQNSSNYFSSRLELYTDYEAMDRDSILAAALDLYADESTTKNETGEILLIKSDDNAIRKILHNLYYDILNLNFNLWPWVRNMVKYGDFYLKLNIDEEYGVTNVSPMSVYELSREEYDEPGMPDVRYMYQGYGAGSGLPGMGDKQYLENYEVAHFRILSDTNFLPYGKSMMEGARKTWKALMLMEDAMLLNRIMRAPERRLFKIDIGNIPPNEVDSYMEKVIAKMKKIPYIDQATGDYNLKFNLQNMLEDYYLPVRGNQSTTDITTLNGLEWNAIDDIEYLKSKMMASLKIPKAFIGFEEGIEGKATLAAMDIRFARTIEMLQRVIVSELTKIGIIHLYVQGYTDASLVNFEIELTSPSIVYEQQKIELLTSKVTLAQAIKDSKILSYEYIYRNIFEMADEEIIREKLRIKNDAKFQFIVDQIAAEGNDPTVSGEAVGTPGSLNTQAGGNDEQGGNDGEPVGDEGEGGGRPIEPGTLGKDNSMLGRDPLGKKGISDPLKPESPTHNYKGKTPLSPDKQKKAEGKKLSKAIIFESLREESPLGVDDFDDTDTILDENRLLID